MRVNEQIHSLVPGKIRKGIVEIVTHPSNETARGTELWRTGRTRNDDQSNQRPTTLRDDDILTLQGQLD